MSEAGANAWLLWQLADSAFPTGGFAHSGGLEAARQHRAVRDRVSLTEFLRDALHQLVHASLPFVQSVYSGECGFADADARCDAFLLNHVTNRASRLQGQAFLSTVDRVFGLRSVRDFRASVDGLPGHLAPVFGATAQMIDLDSECTARLFVFTQLRGWISAAVRLNIVGPIEGQAVQHDLAAAAENVSRQFGAVPMEACAQTAPFLDLWQGTQDRLYSRLFQS